MPDYRHTPEVERILKLQEEPLFEKKENPTPEEIEENERWWKEFRASPVVKFLTRALEISDKLNEIELQENAVPYRREDKKLWQVRDVSLRLLDSRFSFTLHNDLNFLCFIFFHLLIPRVECYIPLLL